MTARAEGLRAARVAGACVAAGAGAGALTGIGLAEGALAGLLAGRCAIAVAALARPAEGRAP